MSKTSREQINKQEFMVMKELIINGKASVNGLANKFKFSRQKIWRMLKSLEKRKVIVGYHAVIDRKQLGLQKYTFLIKRSIGPTEKNNLDALLGSAIQKKADAMDIIIDTFSYVNGRYDFSFSIYAKDLIQAKKFSFALINIFNVIIEDITVLEELVPIIEDGILHPDRKSLTEFF